MKDRSYQGLKDATLFGLICDKSAEIRGSEYWKNCQFSILADSPIFAFLLPLLSKLADDDVMRMCKGNFFEHAPCRGQAASMEIFQFFEYLDLNYSVLLADLITNEVASCRY